MRYEADLSHGNWAVWDNHEKQFVKDCGGSMYPIFSITLQRTFPDSETYCKAYTAHLNGTYCRAQSFKEITAC